MKASTSNGLGTSKGKSSTMTLLDGISTVRHPASKVKVRDRIARSIFRFQSRNLFG